MKVAEDMCFVVCGGRGCGERQNAAVVRPIKKSQPRAICLDNSGAALGCMCRRRRRLLIA